MSLKTEGSSCARCHAYLFSEDDIVYCPVCGAPHHRECYDALGHCALEELHGTDRQYSREKEELARSEADAKNRENQRKKEDSFTTCKMCGESYNREIRRCPKCNTPNLDNFEGYQQFDFLGGVPADLDLGEGVTAEEAKRFVAANPQRYIPKFAILNPANKSSWNWMAFLFPCEWMLSRKMYKGGIIAGIFSIMAVLLAYPLNNLLYSFGVDEVSTYPAMLDFLTESLQNVHFSLFIFAAVGMILEIITRIICAVFGDYWYKEYTLSSIKKIRAESQDMEYDYRKKGGVNFFLFLLGVLALQYIPSLIVTFF